MDTKLKMKCSKKFSTISASRELDMSIKSNAVYQKAFLFFVQSQILIITPRSATFQTVLCLIPKKPKSKNDDK